MTRLARTAVGVLLVALLTGCVGLPDDGPVVEAEVAGQNDADRASSIDGRPPQPGDSRLEIVNGFLNSLMAWPISTNVAKEYLTEDAAEEWSPESTVIYTDLASPREDGSTVAIRMLGAAHLDASGGWRSALPRDRSVLRFRLTVEDGEFRIIDPMDALVVSSDWFRDRYRQASLFFFDPTAQVLVPEPVFVPSGTTFATSLISALLAGPPPRLRDVVKTFVPPRLTVGLSVPVIDGVAILDLGGEAGTTSSEAELMLAQLAATLRQDPRITAVRLSIGGEEVDLPGSASQYDVGSADAFDPSDTASTGVLYGLRRGRLVVGGLGDLRPVEGPFGWRPHDLASVSVAPQGDQVAAITEDQGDVLVAPLRAVRSDAPAIQSLTTDGTEFTRPSWDAVGRLWLLDRAGGDARVMVVDHRERVREVEVTGVTGRDARRILVSRDGTRLVALVSGPRGDRLVTARVALDIGGRVDRVVDSKVIWSALNLRAVDLAWTGPAQVAVLTPARANELFALETVSTDGATVGVDTLSTMVTGRVLGLASEAYADTPVYAVTRSSLIDIRTGDELATAAPVRELDYAG